MADTDESAPAPARKGKAKASASLDWKGRALDTIPEDGEVVAYVSRPLRIYAGGDLLDLPAGEIVEDKSQIQVIAGQEGVLLLPGSAAALRQEIADALDQVAPILSVLGLQVVPMGSARARGRR